MGLSHSPDEVDHGDCISRDSVIRPCHIVEHDDIKGWGLGLISLWRRKAKEEKSLLKTIISLRILAISNFSWIT